MGILCDTQIRELIGIEPFEDNAKRPGKISYGVSSYGYDLRVGSVFKIFTNVNSEIVDPKHFSERSFVTVDTDETGKDYVLIPPNSFALCETVETVEHAARLPGDLRRQEHLRPLRHHRERDADRAGVARQDHAGNQQHHPPAGQDLRQRGHRPVDLPQGRPRLCRQLRRQAGQVPGPGRPDAAASRLIRGRRLWRYIMAALHV